MKKKNRFNTEKCGVCPKKDTCSKYKMLKSHKKDVKKP